MVEEIFQLRKQVEELTEERDRLRGSLALFEAENARLSVIIKDIANAVTDEGRKPGYHKQQVNYLKTMWNPLYQAIRQAVMEVRNG